MCQMNTELFQYALTALYAYIHVSLIYTVQLSFIYSTIIIISYKEKTGLRISMHEYWCAPRCAQKTETESSAYSDRISENSSFSAARSVRERKSLSVGVASQNSQPLFCIGIQHCQRILICCRLEADSRR